MDRTRKDGGCQRSAVGWKWSQEALERLLPALEEMARAMSAVSEESLQQVEPVVRNPDAWRISGMRR